jgi:hypothetical protein
VIGTMWSGECGAGDGPVWGLCRCGGGGVKRCGGLVYACCLIQGDEGGKIFSNDLVTFSLKL